MSYRTTIIDPATGRNLAELHKSEAAAIAAIRRIYPDAVQATDYAPIGQHDYEASQYAIRDADGADVIAIVTRDLVAERAVDLCRQIFAEPVKLTKGDRYDLDTLDCVDWTGDDTGLNCWAYFADGVYLGPDADGVEPLFVVR